MSTWEFQDIGLEGQTKNVSGINIWKYQWQHSDSESFNAPHPQYPNQPHLFNVYKVIAKGKSVTFAASEVSNQVWCVYIQKPSPNKKY